MAAVPVVCQSCGTFFLVTNLIGGDALNVTFIDVGYGPCPACGGDGRLLDGAYDFVGDTVRVLATTPYSEEQFRRLLRIVKRAQRGEVPPEEVATTIKREAPGLAGVADRLLVPRTPEAVMPYSRFY